MTSLLSDMTTVMRSKTAFKSDSVSTAATIPSHATSGDTQKISVGCVSYLNAKPLIYGLEQYQDAKLNLEVPSQLLDGIRRRDYDVALLPVIDYQRADGLCLLPVGGIGCDGPTLTVRIFSRCPIDQIKILKCDTDSHTSVALARVILGELYGITPDFVDCKYADRATDPVAALSEKSADSEYIAQLLIGDKVVCNEPTGFEYQMDLGQGWKELTGLPFVFAIWTARLGVDLRGLPQVLSQCREQGLLHLDDIVRQHAPSRGWPLPLAMQYLGTFLKFEIGETQIGAIARFHELAAKWKLIGNAPRVLRIYGE